MTAGDIVAAGDIEGTEAAANTEGIMDAKDGEGIVDAVDIESIEGSASPLEKRLRLCDA